MTQDLLTLQADGFDGNHRWHWRLTDPKGRFLKDHVVELDPGQWQYRAFLDLTGWIEAHTTPDRRFEEEGRIVSELGAWIGEHVLGPVGRAILAFGNPVTVQMTGTAFDALVGEAVRQFVTGRALVDVVRETLREELHPG